MEIINESKDEIKKVCRCCKIECLESEFEPKRHQCRKCMNKKRYESNKKNNYYNNYYNQHKDIVLNCQHKYYIRKRDKKKDEVIISENEN